MRCDRRMFVGGAAALVATPLVGQGAGIGGVMRARASALLEVLEPAQAEKALFGFESRQRKAWTFMLGARKAAGLALEDMTALQKDLALDLLVAGTSAFGFEKAQNIMLQQDILRDEWQKGSADRNRERFSLQIYGRPTAQGAWGWRWEGHHLSLSFTLLDDELVSTTPSAFSSEPNTVPSGPHKGLVVLKEEEVLGRALFDGLSGAERRAALVWEGSPGNIVSTRGREGAVLAEGVGVALGALDQGAQDMARRLLEVYTTEVLPGEAVAAQAGRLGADPFEEMRFAWGGADLNGSIYYRFSGRHTLIEFATLRNQPQHLHAVYHDVGQNFGAHVL